MAEHEQREVLFSGAVQGVGFRMRARDLAHGKDLTGYVQNRSDGQVKLVVEGTTEAIDAYITTLRQDMARYIEGTDITTRTATGEFERFEIRG